ncbi:MAG: HEPN domain-containing protein [Nitrospirae bacterium]|nr:HEPN domain-containing protein [Nitrospirota bacterium]
MDEIQRNQVQKRLSHARDSLKDAKALFTEGAEPSFVMNSLYYTFLYPVLGLLQARQIPAPIQSTAISLFEREYVQTGIFESRFLDAFRKAFDLRPACECQKNIAKTDIEELLPVAQEFLDAVEKNIQ